MCCPSTENSNSAFIIACRVCYELHVVLVSVECILCSPVYSHIPTNFALCCLQDGRTALVLAALKGHSEIAHMLVEANAGIDIQNMVI